MTTSQQQTIERIRNAVGRPAFAFWQWLTMHVDDTDNSVRMSRQEIAKKYGVTSRTVSTLLSTLSQTRPRLARGGRGVIYVVRNVQSGCESCGEKTEASMKLCRRCVQSYRADRVWQMKAIELAVYGKTPTEIAVACNKSLWGDVHADRIREASASGIVPFLCAEHPHLIDSAWRRRWDAVRRNEVED